MNLSRQEKLRAESLLRALLPAAREKAAEHDFKTEAQSAIGKAHLPYIIESNLEGIHIYHANTGGWIADLYFKNIPIGVPNVIGTPVGRPCKNREEALENATMMLATVINNKPTEPPPPDFVFTIYDMCFPLPLEMLETVAKAQMNIEGEVGYGSKDNAIKRLENALKHYFGDAEPSYDLLQSLSHDAKIHLTAICCMCSLSGILRYPPPAPTVIDE